MTNPSQPTIRTAQDQFRTAKEQVIYALSAAELGELPKLMKEMQTDITAKTRSRKRDVIVLVGLRG